MFLKIRNFQHINDLLFEANLIRIGDEFNGLSQEYNDDKGTSVSTASNVEVWNKLDSLLDSLLAKGIIDLDADLAKPIYEKEFGSARGKQITEAYLVYCKNRISKIRDEIRTELLKDEADSDKVSELTQATLGIAARIEALDKIYTAFKSLQQVELSKLADDVNQKIVDLKQTLSDAYTEPIAAVGDSVKPQIVHLENANTSEAERIKSAKSIMDKLNSLNQLIVFYPIEAQEGAKQAKAKVEQTIKSFIGDDRFSEFQQEILSNDHEASILRRILDLKYMNFTNEEEIYKEVDGIKISMNSLVNPKGKIRSKPEVIAYLEKQLAEVTDEILTRARDKSITLDKATGIHYDCNTKLKLHEITDLPVTGKQLADSSIIMKFRKKFTEILNLLIPSRALPMTAAGQAFSNFGEQTHKAYAVTLNSAAKLIGRTIGGRTGELKADAYSRMLIPGTSVLDKKPTSQIPIATKITEDGGAPGVAMQTGASISGMGPIEAPTRTSFGSGDNFIGSVKKKRKLKKRRSVYEDQVQVLNFSSFINENNDND
jgi:hypothetical protein